MVERVKTISASQLSLEPLTVAHAEAMFGILSEPQIYKYLDYGPPPSVEHLRSVYSKLESRQSPDGKQQWLNWVVRFNGGSLLGYVQATVAAPEVVWVAYVFGTKHWGHGYASAATAAMIEHLEAEYGSNTFLATVEADNERSIALLKRLSFLPASPAEVQDHELTISERLFVRKRDQGQHADHALCVATKLW